MHTDNIKAEAVNLKLLIVQNKRGSSGLTFATLTFKDCWPIVFHDLKDIQQMCVCVYGNSHTFRRLLLLFNRFVSQSSESVQSVNVITNILSFVTMNVYG